MVEHFDECPLMRLLPLFSEVLRHTDCYILRQFEMLWHPLLRPAIKGTGHVQKFGHNSQLLPCPIWVGKFYHYQNKNSSIQKILNVSQREERGTEERRETNAIDYITGLIVAGVFKQSTKTKTGALESKAGWKGLCRKCATLALVLVAYRLDIVIGTNYIRDAVIIAFIANETISIVENAGLMGVPMPPIIIKAIDILETKAEGGTKE